MPIDPLASQQIEIIREPATLRYGSEAIGGVVSATNNRIPARKWIFRNNVDGRPIGR